MKNRQFIKKYNYYMTFLEYDDNFAIVVGTQYPPLIPIVTYDPHKILWRGEITYTLGPLSNEELVKEIFKR